MTAALARALERFLLPNTCVACERVVASGTPDALVCSVCLSRLEPVGPGCVRCQQPLPPVGPCRFCQGWPDVVIRVRSAVWIGPEARAMIHHLKYEGYTRVADDVADRIARAVERPPDRLLVPVPLGQRRERQRGYNQAAVIARALARRWGLPVARHLLARRRETRSQTALTPEDRRRNVAGAFVAAPLPNSSPGQRGAPSAPGKGGRGSIILLDDVLTTGATLMAAADALAAAGWPVIEAVTFARALPFVRRIGGS